MGESKFYVVKGDCCLGIFKSLSRALSTKLGCPGAEFQSFSTLREAKAFLEKKEKTASCSSRATLGWNGQAYAVAVGRQVGVFRNHHEALSQTLFYSGNSLKKFPTYAEAVQFLDRHQWRNMPVNNEATGLKVETSADDSSTDVSSEGEEENPQDPLSPVGTPKRERDGETAKDPRASQRRRICYDEDQFPDKADLVAICCGTRARDHEGTYIVQMICQFPVHAAWNVSETVHGSNATTTRAGLLAVLKLLKRAASEDPSYETAAVVYTMDQPLFDALSECARGGWQSVDENGDLLKQITEVKKARCIKLLHLGGANLWKAGQSGQDDDEVMV
ncbi:unnamed protein product [Phytophthora fragariaefolia]|uniref:Unnamed protein product n=1 Tax=Phytophthora fragariaefolia TaxID=1490495 RepID=A0A9W6TQ32_9STRA|nr:unnamed protein product [Phytophthora fragariaefolia]